MSFLSISSAATHANLAVRFWTSVSFNGTLRDVNKSFRPMHVNADALAQTLRRIVGRRHVLVGARRIHGFVTGYRYGSGPASLVVRPGTLIQQWRVLQACVAADVIVIAQAANTGLTGGSTPNGVYDRPVVVLSTTRMKGLHLLGGGEQIICFPGTTLDTLEQSLAAIGREPHSIIGSSCIGASVLGGICNNSGGALVRRGPAFTRLALFARLDPAKGLQLHNHLGIALGNDPETILQRLEAGEFGYDDVAAVDTADISDLDYQRRVRLLDEPTPARFNADPGRLFEASGSAGRVVVFAVRLATFPKEQEPVSLYIGAADPDLLGELRRELLSAPGSLPISAEYMHRDAIDVALAYGKDMSFFIQVFGTHRVPALFAMKNRIDAFVRRFAPKADGFSDRMLQRLSRLLPYRVPARLLEYRARFEHHLILKISHSQVPATCALLDRVLAGRGGAYFRCSPAEAAKAFLLRFAVAGAAVRYRCVHADRVQDVFALDIALPRNAATWQEVLPPEIASACAVVLYYGHFLCHVFHQDYVLRRDCDAGLVDDCLHALMDERGAIYPAEHNVGHLYAADENLAGHYRSLDPCNVFNPGIGQTPRRRDWMA